MFLHVYLTQSSDFPRLPFPFFFGVLDEDHKAAVNNIKTGGEFLSDNFYCLWPV